MGLKSPIVVSSSFLGGEWGPEVERKETSLRWDLLREWYRRGKHNNDSDAATWKIVKSSHVGKAKIMNRDRCSVCADDWRVDVQFREAEEKESQEV